MITYELIQGCKTSNRAAQKQLYSLLLPYLNIVCKRYLNNNEERQDILQEAFINIFSNIDKYDSSRSQFKTWAVKIVINCCLKHNQKSAKIITKEFVIEKHTQAIDPEILAWFSDEDLLAFLKTMPQKYFEIFNLHIIDGFSHKEIGELLGIDDALSRKRLSRAREWLSASKQQTKLKALRFN